MATNMNMGTTPPIRLVEPTNPNLKGITGAVRVHSGKNFTGTAHEIDHAVNAYNRMTLDELNYKIMSVSLPPMTRVTLYTSNNLTNSASGQLTIANTKLSPLFVSDLGMDVNSMMIKMMEVNQIVNTDQVNQVQNQGQFSGVNTADASAADASAADASAADASAADASQIAMTQTATQIPSQTEPFDNGREAVQKYTTTEMALFLIFLALLIYIVYNYNKR